MSSCDDLAVSYTSNSPLLSQRDCFLYPVDLNPQSWKTVHLFLLTTSLLIQFVRSVSLISINIASEVQYFFIIERQKFTLPHATPRAREVSLLFACEDKHHVIHLHLISNRRSREAVIIVSIFILSYLFTHPCQYWILQRSDIAIIIINSLFKFNCKQSLIFKKIFLMYGWDIFLSS